MDNDLLWLDFSVYLSVTFITGTYYDKDMAEDLSSVSPWQRPPGKPLVPGAGGPEEVPGPGSPG